jgi:hypothetical protein
VRVGLVHRGRTVRRRVVAAGLVRSRIAEAGGPRAGLPHNQVLHAAARPGKGGELRPPDGVIAGPSRPRHGVSATGPPSLIRRLTRGRAPAPDPQGDEGDEARQRDDQQGKYQVPPQMRGHQAARRRDAGNRSGARGGRGARTDREGGAEQDRPTVAGHVGDGHVGRARPPRLGVYQAGVRRRGRQRSARSRQRCRSGRRPGRNLLGHCAAPSVEHCRILPRWAQHRSHQRENRPTVRGCWRLQPSVPVAQAYVAHLPGRNPSPR